MTTTSTRPSMSDTPANAAITAAAYDLHLPAEAARLAEIAVRERQSHPVFLAEVLAAEVDERAERRRTRRIAAAKFPRIKRLAEFNVDAVPTISSAQLATLATAAYLVWSPATAVSTCSCSMSSATSRSTRAAPSCCSRSPPNARNAPPSASGQTCRSASGNHLRRPTTGRRDRRQGHLQRAHPRDRHPVLPARHQQDPYPQQQDQQRRLAAMDLDAVDATELAETPS
jgi:hypothetical protein